MKSSELMRILKQDGWIEKRQKGSHVVMVHTIKSGILIVPNHGSAEVGTGLANKLLKQAGIK